MLIILTLCETYVCLCNELNCVCYPLASVNMTLPENRVFADVIRAYKMSVILFRVGLYKKRYAGSWGECCVMTETEIGW